MKQLVLSLFPGIGLLDRAFEEEGFCVVRGPDLLWGGDIKTFHPPAGVFDGVIGGPPCQCFSSMRHIVKAQGFKPRWGNLIPDFERVIDETRPQWFVMENVRDAPIPAIEGYIVDPTLLNNRWLGEAQHRVHRFSFGTCDGRNLNYEIAALECPEWVPRVTTDARTKPVKLLAGGKPKHNLNHTGKSLSIDEMLRRQGAPPDLFEHSPFTKKAQRAMLGNAVPYWMALALAQAVKRALGLMEAA